MRSYSRTLASISARSPQFQNEIDAEFVRLIYLTSPLHDIGKVGIPDCVLLKPGRLSDVEFDIMKQHAMLAQTLEQRRMQMFPNTKFLKMARDIAATHHERWDSTGYPAMLKGTDIPLCGRIVACWPMYTTL